MGKFENVLAAILRGTSDNNLAFADLQYALQKLGFEVRIKGDHFIYTKQGVVEIINVQPLGGNAKAYQVKQVRALILKYKLAR
ncbi:MAG: type II toxin-antitoxin system HicA family toxin [Burkholderiales bacterium]|nr:type II toxin-antitoxin system HicA family toxin [Burkholderiales bacterium]